MKKLSLILAASLIFVSLLACAAPAKENNESSKLENVTGLSTVGLDVSEIECNIEINIGSDKKTFTHKDFEHIKFTKFEVISGSENEGDASEAKSVKYTVINIKEILSYYKVENYSDIVFENAAGEAYKADKNAVDFGVFLAVQKDNKALSEDQGPVLVIPSSEKESSYISNCTRIMINS